MSSIITDLLNKGRFETSNETNSSDALAGIGVVWLNNHCKPKCIL